MRIFLVMLAFAGSWLGEPRDLRAAGRAGNYEASSLQVSWAIGDWSESCGAQPSGGGEPGGAVVIQDAQSEFTFSGLGREYRSDQCWEQMPGLSPTAHTVSSASLQTICKMPAGDPRQATVITTWAVRENAIYFDETGQYQFTVQGGNCTASVRRTRVLHRVLPQAAKPSNETSTQTHVNSAPSATVSESAAPTPLVAPLCAEPGPAVRLEVSPRMKLMQPGQSFRFRAEARDARGCRANFEPRWRLLTESPGIRLSSPGVLQVEQSAPPTHLRLEVSHGDHTVEVFARVTSPEQYERLLEEGGFGERGESHEQAVLNFSAAALTEDTATTQTDSARAEERSLLLRGLLGAAALGLVALFFLFRHGRKPRASRSFTSAPEPTPPEPSHPLSKPSFVTPSTITTPPRKLCPVCGKDYPEDSIFCGDDGARLLRKN